MYNKVSICGVDTAQLPIINEKRKAELLSLAEKGDKKAREELVNGNLRLVLSVVQRFANRGENPDDLFQVGCIGLMKSIDNFDTSQNVRFSTYAVPMIIGEIRRYLRDNNSIRVSRSIKDTAYKAMQAKESLIAELETEPTVNQIAEKINLPVCDVVVALESTISPISLYDPVFSDGGDALFVMDQVGDNNDDKNWLGEIALKQAINELSPREKNILSLRFIQGKTQIEVSNKIGISQAQVSRLEKSAIEKIRAF